MGKSDFDFFTEEHARPAYEAEQEIIRTGQPLLNLEEKETWPDRPDTWVATTKLPLRDHTGAIIGTFGVSRDITDRKQAEEALTRAYAEVEQQVAERTAALQREVIERERLQEEVIEAQRRALAELSTPIIPGAGRGDRDAAHRKCGYVAGAGYHAGVAGRGARAPGQGGDSGHYRRAAGG